MVRIKICGITRLEDALCAEECGAHALGFIFYKKSKRYIEPILATKIIEKLNPFISKVGVFVNEDIEVIKQIIANCGITHVQLHGDETIDFAAKINNPVLRALNFDDNINQKIKDWEEYPILIDSGTAKKPGGTGKTLPWDSLKSFIKNRKIILAGGLTPENITTAIKIVKPMAVDVNSGVEKSPGIKNRDLIEKFIINVNKINKES